MTTIATHPGRAQLTDGLTVIAREVLELRPDPGRLIPQEHFYYRFWVERQWTAGRRSFVSKIAQQAMHEAAGTREWYVASADKVLFQTIIGGPALTTPEMIAITHKRPASCRMLQRSPVQRRMP